MGWTINEYISGDDRVVYIDISSIDADLETLIDKCIVDICYKDDAFKISKAKKYIRDFINTENEDRKKGAIAEFFLHLYLNSINMEQACLFKNLEENSPKKGFDGVYKDENKEVWYVESKSGAATSCTHAEKVQEAFRDLKKKFSSTTRNDPWLNAYHHLRGINPTDPLLAKFRALSDIYSMGKAIDMSEYNISPCGTVYDDTYNTYPAVSISNEVFNYFSGKDYKKLFSICVTQRSVAEFENYLGR